MDHRVPYSEASDYERSRRLLMGEVTPAEAVAHIEAQVERVMGRKPRRARLLRRLF